jgi:hypothetical protein
MTQGRAFTYETLSAAVEYVAVSAVVSSELVRKREDGTSILDELTNKAPEWMEKGKQYATQTIDQVSDQIKQFNRKS